MSLYNFRAKESSLTKLCHKTCCKVGMIVWVQRLGETTPLKFGRTKNIQNLVRFRTFFDFDHEYLWKGVSCQKNGIASDQPQPPLLNEKNWRNCVH